MIQFFFLLSLIPTVYMLQLTIPRRVIKQNKFLYIIHNEYINDLCSYKGKERKKLKNLLGISDLVQDHHIIPKQWKNHSLLNLLEFDINHSNNIISMPNKKGKAYFHLNENRVIHDGGHVDYNYYIKYILDNMYKEFYQDKELLEYQFTLFQKHLIKNMYINQDNIPWQSSKF